jgi:hypothetical protein
LAWGVHLFCLGKFGQNIEKTQTAFVSYQEDLEKLVYNANLEIKNVVLIGQAAMQVNYQTKGSRVVPSRATQIIHAGMVTALSRIELDVAMREILNIEGSRILYADTGNFLCLFIVYSLKLILSKDSIMYTLKKGTKCPLKTHNTNYGFWKSEIAKGWYVQSSCQSGTTSSYLSIRNDSDPKSHEK